MTTEDQKKEHFKEMLAGKNVSWEEYAHLLEDLFMHLESSKIKRESFGYYQEWEDFIEQYLTSNQSVYFREAALDWAKSGREKFKERIGKPNGSI